MQNSGLLLAGLCFLEMNLQGPHCQLRAVLSHVCLRAAWASLHCSVRLCRGCT